ncbi:hypothetical protein L596_028975 [Steinernema carpocapsae]|uniref:Uncharacterized protein n=1 Tax=Steinernema carpocapsae TaxID=34508 RepID=A0A4U5LT86_STECR|nr:hypothetical protein L596_028975 [Steinernema carpocapsae]
MTQTKGDLDIEAEHKRWRQFEIAPIRSAEDAKLEGYDFRCIQQRTSSQNVECMPFHYYCELKSVRFDSVFFRSTSSAPEYTSNPAADEELDDDEIEIEDFPIYDQAIFEDQGFLTDFPSGEEVLDILETCTRTGCMLSMTEFEEEILEMMPMLKSIEKRIKKVDICKIRFGHLDPEKRKPLQSTFEAWLRGLIEDNGLLQLRLEEVSLGGRARPDKSLEDVPEEDEEAEPPENEEEPEETLLDWKAYLGRRSNAAKSRGSTSASRTEEGCCMTLTS